MEFTPSITDLPALVIAILAGHFIINKVSRKHPTLVQRSLLVKLFYYHLLFSFIYCTYIMIFGGDSIGYWRYPVRFIHPGESIYKLHEPGSPFVHLLTYPLAHVFGLSLWGGGALFTLFGFGGVTCVYLTLRKVLRVNPQIFGVKLFPIILFLPNMHFWSAGVGKDSVVFFALCLFIYGLTDPKKNLPFFVLSFYLAFYMRPHIALVMVVAAGLALVMTSGGGVSAFWRVSLIVVAIATFLAISSTVFEFVGIEEESIESYEDITTIRSKNLSRSNVGSRIDVVNLPVPLRMFTFLYRPLFIDAVNVLGLVISLENLFYVILSIAVLRWRNIRRMITMPLPLKTSFVLAFAVSYFMSGSLSNLGIIIRQKNMVMFMIVLVTMYLLSEYQSSKIRQHKRVRLRTNLNNATNAS